MVFTYIGEYNVQKWINLSFKKIEAEEDLIS